MRSEDIVVGREYAVVFRKYHWSHPLRVRVLDVWVPFSTWVEDPYGGGRLREVEHENGVRVVYLDTDTGAEGQEDTILPRFIGRPWDEVRARQERERARIERAEAAERAARERAEPLLAFIRRTTGTEAEVGYNGRVVFDAADVERLGTVFRILAKEVSHADG